MHHSYKAQLTAVRTPANPGADKLTIDGKSAHSEVTRPTMEGALAGVLDRFGQTEFALEMLRGLAEIDPDLFFAAGIARLELEGGSPSYRKRSLGLFDSPEFLLSLVGSKRFNTQELKDFCARYAREDSLLDVKLARLLPGRMSDRYHLETDFILRILEILDEISRGPRLLTIIDHLTNFPEPRVASKAALLVGRRLQNRHWVERHISSTDPRVRANVAEALWGVDSELAKKTLCKCLLDENNRVRGNATVGLHLLGDRKINWYVRRLAKDSRAEFRQTAVWVIGKVGEPDFAPLLEELLLDPSQEVRQSAEKALNRLRELSSSKNHTGPQHKLQNEDGTRVSDDGGHLHQI